MKKEMENNEYFLGKYEAKYSRYEAEYKKEKQQLERQKRFRDIILWSLISVDVILMGFVRFCEMRFGASCLKMFTIEMLITAPVFLICLYMTTKKERRLYQIQKKLIHFMDKINNLDSVA